MKVTLNAERKQENRRREENRLVKRRTRGGKKKAGKDEKLLYQFKAGTFRVHDDRQDGSGDNARSPLTH